VGVFVVLRLAREALAWTISLGDIRGGPVFPSPFLGAAAGVMAAQLPGFSITPAVAVGMGQRWVGSEAGP
jgi:H+/Cl- antiporter ClcA